MKHKMIVTSPFVGQETNQRLARKGDTIFATPQRAAILEAQGLAQKVTNMKLRTPGQMPRRTASENKAIAAAPENAATETAPETSVDSAPEATAETTTENEAETSSETAEEATAETGEEAPTETAETSTEETAPENTEETPAEEAPVDLELEALQKEAAEAAAELETAESKFKEVKADGDEAAIKEAKQDRTVARRNNTRAQNELNEYLEGKAE